MIIGLNSLVPSKNIKAYITKIGREFSKQEEATLVYLSRLDYDVKIAFLKKIVENCTNEENELKEEINTRIAKMTSEKNKFFAQEENVVYSVHFYFNKNDFWDKVSEIFSSLENAKNYAKKEIKDDSFLEESPTKIKITKRYIDTEPSEYIYAIFDTDFNLKEINSGFIKEFEEDITDFSYKYVDIPYPFRRGDLVKDINTNKIYIVNRPFNDEEYNLWVENNKKYAQENKIDAFDIGLCVEQLDKGSFVEAYLFPTQAEYIDLDTVSDISNAEKEYLKSISRLLKGEESLEMFSELQKDYLKSI